MRGVGDFVNVLETWISEGVDSTVNRRFRTAKSLTSTVNRRRIDGKGFHNSERDFARVAAPSGARKMGAPVGAVFMSSANFSGGFQLDRVSAQARARDLLHCSSGEIRARFAPQFDGLLRTWTMATMPARGFHTEAASNNSNLRPASTLQCPGRSLVP